MKILAKFLGRVNKYHAPPDISYVTLKDLNSGQVYETDAVSEKLLAAGIDHDDCEFEIIVEEDVGGCTTAVLTKLGPLPVSDEELKKISEEVDKKLPPPDDFAI